MNETKLGPNGETIGVDGIVERPRHSAIVLAEDLDEQVEALKLRAKALRHEADELDDAVWGLRRVSRILRGGRPRG